MSCLKSRIHLGVLPALEINRLIFAYWHPQGKLPDWRIPEISQQGWSSYVVDSKPIRATPRNRARTPPITSIYPKYMETSTFTGVEQPQFPPNA